MRTTQTEKGVSNIIGNRGGLIRYAAKYTYRADGGGTVALHVLRNRFDALALTKGQQVYVSPTHVRVFAEPASACA
jgi:hypothetical protein